MPYNLLANLRHQSTSERRLIMQHGRLFGPNVFVDETHAAMGLTVAIVQLTPLFQFPEGPLRGATVVVNDGEATPGLHVVRLPLCDEEEQLFRFRRSAEGEETQSIDKRGLDKDRLVVGPDLIIFLDGPIDPEGVQIGLSP